MQRYYDNAREEVPAPQTDDPRPWIDVERVYLLNWDAFDDWDWQCLQEVYRSLPGWMTAEDLPRWFGVDEDAPPYLWASVEPPGLQVVGDLPVESFLAWHTAFLDRSAELPFRPLD